MRLIRMNSRSRYKGRQCLHCHKHVADGRVGLASTYYIYNHTTGRPWVMTQRLTKMTDPGIEVRVVYHRKCIEKILTNGLLDPEVERTMFEEYRDSLAEQFESA